MLSCSIIVRNPETHEPVVSSATTLADNAINAIVDVLWAGWGHECCTKKHAYHLSFPAYVSP
jgi:hypothetical protein